jgi:hypothetical protein
LLNKCLEISALIHENNPHVTGIAEMFTKTLDTNPETQEFHIPRRKTEEGSDPV